MEVEKQSGTDRKITNLAWEKITSKELFDIQNYTLPREDQYEISNYTNPYTQEKTTNFRVAALKFEKGIIYRLSSFSIMNAEEKRENKNWTSKIGTSENPLKQGNFYKIKVDKSGVFKITTKFLRDHGMNPANINPKNFRIYGNGGLMLPEHNLDPRFDALQENAIQVAGEDDGVWNEDDYALFYAQGPNGYNVYKKANGNGKRRIETRSDKPNNFINIYEDFAYYFINFDKGPGKRIQPSDVPTNSSVISRYDEYQYINEEKFNLMKVGRIWTGDAFTNNKTVSFNTRSAIQPSDVIVYRTRYIAYQSQGNKMTVNLNNLNPVTFSVASNDKREYIPEIYSSSVSNLSGNQISFNYAPNTGSNPNGKFYFDYAEVQYKEDLKFNNSQMNFRSYGITEESGNTYTFNLADASSAEQVWQVSDITNVVKKVNKSGNSANFNFGYVADSNVFVNEFVAFKNSEAFTPDFVGKVDNQDLAGLQNIEYLMITVPEMMGQAQRLANYYQDKYTVAVVDINKIYNEFSSGSREV